MKSPLVSGLGVLLVLVAPLTCGAAQPAAAPSPDAQAFLQFVKAQATAWHAGDQPPATPAAWATQKAALRQNLERAWGGFPAVACPLEPRKLGELARDGYRVEKIIFQTRPGIWMTANAYVPDQPGRLPAVLCVHGHWRGAKQDPVVQARCIGLAKQGFFVLAVDAFGAGERAIGKALGEYHGEMTAATLLPTGLPLSGLQVYENMRAVDYLRTRPEVDGTRIGITGASGGGNQTMYAGAYDERFSAVVPVCSVGSYYAYLGFAACMCEVVPGVLKFTEESSVLGLAAPRGLMVINATQDSFVFSVGEAKKSLAGAQSVFDLYGKRAHVQHAVFESKHDYNQPMREAMYGWMTRHLKGRGEGSPLPEPVIKTEDPETLRCFPGDTRPDDFITIPQFAAAEGRRILASRTAPATAAAWRGETVRRQAGLVDALGGFPPVTPLDARSAPANGATNRVVNFSPETGLTLTVSHETGTTSKGRLAVLLDLAGAEKAGASELAAELRRAGWSLALPELRATGRYAWPRDTIGRAPDHNTAEWSLLIGRPLLGQWTLDVRRALDALAQNGGALPKDITVIGVGPAGVVALCAAAVDPRITAVATVGSLASYVSETPYSGQRLGLMAPGILREAGDIAHLAALVAPRRLVVAGGVNGGGAPLDANLLAREYTYARGVYTLVGAADAMTVLPETAPREILGLLR